MAADAFGAELTHRVLHPLPARLAGLLNSDMREVWEMLYKKGDADENVV